MYIMKMFNDQVAALPAEKERILKRLQGPFSSGNVDGWTKKQLEDAYRIVEAEEFELIKKEVGYNEFRDLSRRNDVEFKPHEHFFSLESCSISIAASSDHMANHEALREYVESLLYKLNKQSDIIQFRFSCVYFDKKKCGDIYQIYTTF